MFRYFGIKRQKNNLLLQKIFLLVELTTETILYSNYFYFSFPVKIIVLCIFATQKSKKQHENAKKNTGNDCFVFHCTGILP